jgi:DNA repair protein RadD
MTPYPYQKDLFERTLSAIDEGHKGVAVYLPTRGGKSIVALQIVEHFRDVWFLAHTKILISQMSQELTDAGHRHGIIAPGYPRLRYRVQVISKDSLHVRLPEMQSWTPPKVIIIDEAHLCQAQRYKDIIAAYPNTIIVGMSATWIRLDRKGFTPPFTKLVKGPSQRELQAIGRLCKIETFAAELFDDTGVSTAAGDYNKAQVSDAVDKPFVLKETVRHWKKHAEGKKTLVFCSSIKHADDMARQFSESGYPAESLSSANDAGFIAATLKRFYAGEFKVLVSVDLFVMGMTVRDCECIVQARPTKSLMIYLQCVGRGTMVSPGKPHLINLDTCNNWARHGFPDADREWYLDAPPKIDKGVSELKKCPACERPILRVLMECPHCGHVFEKALPQPRALNEKDGELVRLGGPQLEFAMADDQVLIRRIAREARNVQQAVRVARAMGMPEGRAHDIWVKVLKNRA